MRMLRTTAVLAGLCASAVVASAGEPSTEFLEAMRERGFYDYAIVYLDQMSASPKATAAQKALVPFEKATTYIEWARNGSAGNPDLATKNYDQALALLDQFIKDNPKHEKAGQANSDRGRILLGKARLETWQARSPGNEGNRGEFQRRAFDSIRAARDIFQTARDQHEKTWKSFPPYLDQKAQPQQFEQRRLAEVRFIQAQLDLAESTYEEAQTYDKDDAQYKKRLHDAADEFQKIHDRYRSQLGGWHARAKQGKCFEESDDVVRALGIYGDLLSQPDDSPAVIRLKDLVRQFRLICLNHPSKKDYQVVIDESNEWYNKASASRRSSMVGLGILWEQARAYEKLGEEPGIPRSDQVSHYRAALKTVQTVRRYPSQYRDLASSKERDLLRVLQGDNAVDSPKDFVSASSLAEELVTKKTKDVLDAINAAKRSGRSDDLQKANDALKTHIAQSLKAVRAALRLVDYSTPQADLDRMRHYLAYMHYLSRNSYETAVISEHLATHAGKDNVGLAQEAAYMAVGAYVQAFNENERNGRVADQEIDIARMERMAKFLTSKWPSSDRAMDARLQMGNVYATFKKYDQAAAWLQQVPESSGKYIDAQQRAAQVLWSAYIEAAQLPDIDKPPQAKLDEWITVAEAAFRKGIDKAERDTPAANPATDSLIAAKVALVQILVTKGEFAEGVKLLTQEPHPVIFNLTVQDETKRPKTGIKSVEFASLAYQLLLRCYVGTQQLNEARSAMFQLELVGGGGGEHITEVYKDLGLELQKELDRLKGLGQAQRLEAVRRSFETFLGDLSKRKDQTSGSLIWIGETYYGLGVSSTDDSKRSLSYFKNASEAYEQIIDRAKDNSKFLDADRVTAVRLRLAACRRKLKQFDQALELLRPILAENATYLDAQFEANFVFQDWGGAGEKNSSQYYQKALAGEPKGASGSKKPGIGSWGWATTVKNIHRLLSQGLGDDRKGYEAKLNEAIYNQAVCHLEYGLSLSGTKRKEQLTYAKGAIRAFVEISQDIEPEWWKKFDTKYREVLGKLGEPVKPLERPKAITIAAESPRETKSEASTATPVKPEETSDNKVAKAKAAPVEKPKSSSGAMGFIIFGLVTLVGIGGTAMLVMKNKSRRKPLVVSADAEPAAEAVASRPRSGKSKRSSGQE